MASCLCQGPVPLADVPLARLFEVEGYVFIAEGVEEVCELGFGVGLGGGEVVLGEAVVEHLIAGFAIKSIMGLGGPLA